MAWVKQFEEIRLEDLPEVGGKNASLGEMIATLGPQGVRVPGGFAITAGGYRHFVEAAGLTDVVGKDAVGLGGLGSSALADRSAALRAKVLASPLPKDLEEELFRAYTELSSRYGEEATDVAVRSSATAEDLPEASFAGAQESFLNVRGFEALREAVRGAYASLFGARAIHYRKDTGFEAHEVALSVGVQKMIRSDLASAGVIFTLDPDTGHRGVVVVNSSWGLGESVVGGLVTPDQFWVHKQALRAGHRALFRRARGSKESKQVYRLPEGGVRTEPVSAEDRARFSLTDDEVLTLARWALAVETHYTEHAGADTPMDLEWAKDGLSGELYMVQARPETVHSRRAAPTLEVYHLREKATPLVQGTAVGEAIRVGVPRVLDDPRQQSALAPGELLVTVSTDPDWEPVMKRAAGIVTERGGRTSHAAIVARELGIPALVGATGARSRLASVRTEVTLSCAEGEQGSVYPGALRFDVERIDSATLPHTRTQVMINVGDPERALKLSRLPCDGVGLARMEFIFAGWVGVHPMALLHPERISAEDRAAIAARVSGYEDPTRYFVERLSEGIATIAAAFHPRPVILRFSDFKTNEYANLLGGKAFEPHEANPMLGWRGASRYYHPDFREGFLLEVAAVRRVREELGLTNLHVMVPFCRTPAEGQKVIDTCAEGGLLRGDRGLLFYVMAEIPSNILLADDFAELFDGFSIGSNDLTQLLLGVDRDATTVAPLFDERSPAVMSSCAHLIERAHAHGCTVGICGQAPSDHPDFAAFLVEQEIDSMSLNADALIKVRLKVAEVEQRREHEHWVALTERPTL